jgi:hypothetical protein
MEWKGSRIAKMHTRGSGAAEDELAALTWRVWCEFQSDLCCWRTSAMDGSRLGGGQTLATKQNTVVQKSDKGQAAEEEK